MRGEWVVSPILRRGGGGVAGWTGAAIDPTRNLLYVVSMTARPVKISMDPELLDRIDADPEARDKGRSVFIRSAVLLYLQAKRRREIETRLAGAYAGEADALLEEVEGLLGGQYLRPLRPSTCRDANEQ